MSSTLSLSLSQASAASQGIKRYHLEERKEEEADKDSGFSEESQLLSSVFGKYFALKQLHQFEFPLYNTATVFLTETRSHHYTSVILSISFFLVVIATKNNHHYLDHSLTTKMLCFSYSKSWLNTPLIWPWSRNMSTSRSLYQNLPHWCRNIWNCIQRCV